MQKSLGLIETEGLAAGIEAADAAVKSANVELIGYELTKGGGWTTIKVQGDVGAVKAAVDAARMAANKVTRTVSTRVIARPAAGINMLVHTPETVGDRPPEPPAPPAPPEPPKGPIESEDTGRPVPPPAAEEPAEPEVPETAPAGEPAETAVEPAPQPVPEEPAAEVPPVTDEPEEGPEPPAEGDRRSLRPQPPRKPRRWSRQRPLRLRNPKRPLPSLQRRAPPSGAPRGSAASDRVDRTIYLGGYYYG